MSPDDDRRFAILRANEHRARLEDASKRRTS